MTKKAFQTESKRLLDLMINSIYTHPEIFLRELISNASDAIDKMYYKALTDASIQFNQEDYHIDITVDNETRTLTISDTGIGMNAEELEENLGVIAKSGSLNFKKDNLAKDGYDIIGQFGVGFYSAFMVADRVTVISRAHGSDQAYKWESEGAEGYTIEPHEKEDVGTTITLHLKENADEVTYDQFLQEHELKRIVKKYSDFVRYPIRMEVEKHRPVEGDEEGATEAYRETEVLNSMVPLWRKNKNELKDEDYVNFYHEKHYGFDDPLAHMHIKVDGSVRYNSILYVPSRTPYDYYTKEYEKGLELYSAGVMIMEKCGDLLPDYFSFVKGMVDSEDLSLNISREMLQHDRQLKFIAKNLKTKIKNELERMLEKDRDKYKTFYESFGRQLKYGVYSDFGQHGDFLKDLLLFYSSSEEALVTLAEYVDRMADDQPYIYYASGEEIGRIDRMPQTEKVKDKGYEILYFTDEVDEFSIKMLGTFMDKEFRSVSSGDLGEPFEEEVTEEEKAAHEDLFEAMKAILGDKVKDVRVSKRLKSHPVCLTNEGDLSIEMEKILKQMPDGGGVTADKVLELNTKHPIFTALEKAHGEDEGKFERYTMLLYNQSLMIEGLPVEDPVAFANAICEVMV